MVIRQEAADDVEAIDRVLRTAFPSDAEARLVRAMRSSGNLLLSLLAEIDGQIVGHIAFSPITLEPLRTDNKLWGLAPLAVLPDFQRKGIGSQLTQCALDLCREQKISGVVVLGHPEFYSRFGFQTASDFGLRDEYGGGDAFMLLALADLDQLGQVHFRPSALVKYCADFANL